MESVKIIESGKLYKFLSFNRTDEYSERTGNQGQENNVPQETAPNA